MKSYSQFSESLDDIRLKEWERLDEGTKKEIVKQFAKENNIELDEELLSEDGGLLTIPAGIAGWQLAAGLIGTGALGTHAYQKSQGKRGILDLPNINFSRRNSDFPSSSRTNDQRAETANTNNNKTNTNNNKNEKEERKNEKESEKINRQLQNRNENPNNPNKKPSNWKTFRNNLKQKPFKTIAKTLAGGLVGGGLLDYAGKRLNPNLRTPNNNNGVTTDNNNNNKETKKINPNLVPYKEK